MKLVFFAILALMWIQDDCDPRKKPEPQLAEKKQMTSHPTHRFVLAQPLKDVAFDTQTGQLCRTWEWTIVGPKGKTDTEGNSPERKIGEFAPTCLSLYEGYPTQGDAMGIIDNPN